MSAPDLPESWQAHLHDAGGRIDDSGQWQFTAATGHGCQLTPLSPLGVIEIAGADTTRFLQGQTSAQIDLANGEIAPPTAFCTPKGRMIANAQIARIDTDRYWLLLNSGVAEALRAHLAKFAVFYKTELDHCSDLVALGVSGSDAESVLTTCQFEPPRAEWAMTLADSTLVVRHPHPIPRFVLVDTADRMLEHWHALSRQGAAPVSETHWQLLDIQAGLVWVNDTTSESWLPQMINWEALAGISFKKGCYTGQEVVARAHFRGQVKKRLMHLTLTSGPPPAIGTVVRDDNGKRMGEVVSMVPTSEGSEVLAVLNVREEMPPLTIDEQPATLQSLPYPVERRDPESLAG
ncbi:hypothetical protein C7446_1092 [Kushneria sinocarnis]|uniref:Uncharacterized protein n=1 Tax=Kushneria sinocarnis TaxID=595502 RepID=A0A420WYC4_9GAMM|nr:folate-binding protein YgfZ [Kushneria sinocarnis]RKR06155.1 hypothetical protein C7446_1092 [Kushneria sinocarnis]